MEGKETREGNISFGIMERRRRERKERGRRRANLDLCCHARTE